MGSIGEGSKCQRPWRDWPIARHWVIPGGVCLIFYRLCGFPAFLPRSTPPLVSIFIYPACPIPPLFHDRNTCCLLPMGSTSSAHPIPGRYPADPYDATRHPTLSTRYAIYTPLSLLGIPLTPHFPCSVPHLTPLRFSDGSYRSLGKRRVLFLAPVCNDLHILIFSTSHSISFQKCFLGEVK